MQGIWRVGLALGALMLAQQAAAQLTLYDGEGLRGQVFTADRPISNLERYGFNDRASSAVVQRGEWEVCEHANFQGQCMILRPGQYPSLAAMHLDDRISSVRIVNRSAHIDADRYAPAPVAVYDSHRRGSERLYEANVTSVRAVVGPAEQRCWVEREQVVSQQDGANVPGAIVGAVIGGVLGHQVGGGRGKDIATAGGAVAGAAVGANVGRDGYGQQAYSQNVQRCASAPDQGRPDYWDVTYTFRGEQHRMQTTAPPGPTVTVNVRGEPRA